MTCLEFSTSRPAGDVNSMDDLPKSTWFTPRLGYTEISPQALLDGPRVVGPPEPPIIVTRAKVGGGNPGFIARDSRGHLYLLKFDPPGFPAVETTTAPIVNRLFWGFGYNVPEDYLLSFRREDLGVDTAGELTGADVEAVLEQVAPPVAGVYRSTASLLVPGTILGPVSATGVRKDDPNDWVRHEDRRILRALRVFCAFTNHTDIRIDNSLDVYVGEPGQGHVEHYLLDFGEALGGHGAEHDYRWDGFHHFFSWEDAGKNLVTLGLNVEDWEDLEYTRWTSVGAFQSTIFKPEGWREVWPYAPIRSSRPDDDYWAAKIVGSVTREHLDALVQAADYPEDGAAEYVAQTLMERRQKILHYFLGQVSPVEARLQGEELILTDMGIELAGEDAASSSYQIRFLEDDGDEAGDALTLTGDGAVVKVPVPGSLVEKAGGYLRVEARVVRDGEKAPRPAEFHVRMSGDGSVRLVGVVH